MLKVLNLLIYCLDDSLLRLFECIFKLFSQVDALNMNQFGFTAQLIFKRIQQEMKSQFKLVSLKQLRKELESSKKSGMEDENVYYSSIGTIIDCSGVYRYEANKDYTQKIKIIDASSNQPVQVFIFNKKLEDFSQNIKVGDILLFHKYKGDLYNGNIQIKKPFKVEDSFLRIFNGNPELSNYSPVDRQVVGIDDQNGEILHALQDLRKFSQNYFKTNKVQVIFSKDVKGKADPKKITSSDFDMILRVVSSHEISGFFRITLTNEKDEFQINYRYNVEPGVYKIRSIAEARWEEKYCHLFGNDYTYFLQVSNWMKSYENKQWDKLAQSKDVAIKKAERDQVGTNIIKENLKKPRTKMTLKELFAKDNHNEDVRVTVEVVQILTEFDNLIKKYDAQNQTQKSLQSESGDYIYTIHLLLTDDSLDADNELCNAYVYTYDSRGIQFLPSDLEPTNIYGRNLMNIKTSYQNWKDRLLEETNYLTSPIELVLSPLFNGRETIYRIVDTQILL